jgi:hypothetical protein
MRELSSARPSAALDFINSFYRLRNLFAAKLRQTPDKEAEDEQALAALQAQNEADTARLALKTKLLSDNAVAHAKVVSEKLQKIERLRAEFEREKSKMEDRRSVTVRVLLLLLGLCVESLFTFLFLVFWCFGAAQSCLQIWRMTSKSASASSAAKSRTD